MSHKEDTPVADPGDRDGPPVVHEVREVGAERSVLFDDRCISPHIVPGGSRREKMLRLAQFLRRHHPEALQAWSFAPHALKHSAATDFAPAKPGRPTVYDLRRRPGENWSIFKNGRFVELIPTRHGDVAMRRLKTFVRENDPGALIAKRMRFIST